MAFPLPFHPLINEWFLETYKTPTPVQEEAWPLIVEGEHVLAIAPTGSGKTLTAFLAAISRFASGTYDAGKLSVLYVSPLKALNEDIRRNLTLPLEGIRAHFEKAGKAIPDIRVQTRSGDTPQEERRRFLSMPPSILALTPESLAILLHNPRGREVLSGVRFLIIDEIHAALGSKRGCFLSCQIDRLAMVAGEFQRVALSATVKPPETAAAFVGGIGIGYAPRKVRIVRPAGKKAIDFQVEFPESDSESDETSGEESAEKSSGAHIGKRYVSLVEFIIARIKANPPGASILVFADARRRAERIAYFLNQTAAADSAFSGQPIAYAHHGSLAKDVRREVEKALASGEIPCVVATGSLELGIDIGGVEEVILAGSPSSAATALQRVGRSGHGVGQTSRGWLVPFHGIDLLQATALSGAVQDREIEETQSIENPLDILAQIILSLCAEREWNEDELYETLRGFYVYQTLSRFNYNGVIRMLSGAYESAYPSKSAEPDKIERLRELKRRIFFDEETKTLSAAPGALPLLYTSGGVITSKGYYSMRLAAVAGNNDGGTKIGELDEEFVWERRLGDCFDFGSRSWQITAIGDEAVEVIPLSKGANSVPFWKGESVYRGTVLSQRILKILETFGSDRHRGAPEGLSCDAQTALSDFLIRQKSFQGNIPLPCPSFIPIEIIDDPTGRGDAYRVIFYTFRGGTVNVPLSLALSGEMEAHYGVRVESSADDNVVFIALPRLISADPVSDVTAALHRLCGSGSGETHLRQRLEASGIFGAAFREAAERALLLPRAPFGKRTPLWVMRQRSKRLFDAVRPFQDFPIAAEAWRTCLNDRFDMGRFVSLLDDIQTGVISFDFFKSRQGSPFSKEIGWAETNTHMYTYDERPDLLGSSLDGKNENRRSLSDRVIDEALGNAGARPILKQELLEDFCSRLKRERSDWAPEDERTLCEWVKERIAIPANGADEEWEKLLEYVPAELAETWRKDKSFGGKLHRIRRPLGAIDVIVHRERLKTWRQSDSGSLAAACLHQWLRYQGPILPARLSGVFGLTGDETEAALSALYEQGELVRDVAAGAVTGLVCDRENLELLLRLSRKIQRPQAKERHARFLVPFLAQRQGLLQNQTAGAHSNEVAFWDTLSGFVAPAKLWETEFFPSRDSSYSGASLDKAIQEGNLLWYGAGKEKAAFCSPNDIDLTLPFSPPPRFGQKLPPDFFNSPRSFWEIKDMAAAQANDATHAANDSAASINAVTQALWEEVWRGSLSADCWEPVRKALENGFSPAEAALSDNGIADGGAGYGAVNRRAGQRRGIARLPRAVRERWRAGSPVRGNWFSLAAGLDGDDGELSLLEEDELNRARVRLLLSRWGVLCRPLLEREVPALSWARLLPSMRRMELAGELVTGRFFSSVNSLQFTSPKIERELEEAEAVRGIYWMNACDPASPAGLNVQGVLGDGSQVRRVPSSRLCFRGCDLVSISNRNGKELQIFVKPDDPDITAVLAFLKVPRTRAIMSERKIVVEKINGKTAAGSEYAQALAALGFMKDRGKMILW